MEVETLPARTYHRLLDSVPPASGAVVMGTGIVSVALLLDGRHVLSTILLVLDGIFWVALAVLLPARALQDGRRFAADLRHTPALTAIAGTAVLGSRLTLSGWDWAGAALLIIAMVLWLGLVPNVLRHWQTPTIGASFLLAVATDSLALLAATLAFADRTGWLVYAALAALGLALCFYVFVLSRFQFRQLAVGLGDHWVTGGASAISTLAAGWIALAAERTGTLAVGHDALQTTVLVLWCLTMAWLPALIAAEILRPRLHYDMRRWSTVFPFGMYAACSFIVGAVCKVEGITTFAQVWVWIALAVWLLVVAAMVSHAPSLAWGSSSPDGVRT
ncbi:MAG TPA: tellurite resistance/C4-dicarboxylate transporter family protein [Solirubrobacteraceae bacterium]|nr:tellurite resistance/C4-dicarboxylate transporter family protein [Solirubrobacteraceae bacterium]